jgi:hypothetical protein
MTGSRTTRALFVFAGLLLASGVMTAVAGAERPPSPCEDRNTTSSLGVPPECEDIDGGGDSVNGVDAVTFWKLWSGDVEVTGSPSFDQETSDLEKARIISAYGDVSFLTPPSAAGAWNANDYGDFSAGGSGSSVYPAGVSPSSNAVVKDAYVALFSVGPSTVVHRDGTTERYVAPGGEVRAVSDFRYVVPEDDNSGSIRHYYDHHSTEKTLTLLVDGTVVQQSSSKAPTFSYSGLSGTSTIEVQSNFTVRIRHRKEECTDWNSTTDSCDGSWDETVDEVNEYTQIDTESADVRVYRTPDVDAYRVEYAGADRGGIVVEPDSLWSRVQLGDASVDSAWRFYTASPPGWGEMVTADDDGTSRSESSVQPLVVHAYPEERTVYLNTTDPEAGANAELDLENVTTQTVSGASSLSTNVDLPATTEYERVVSLTATSPMISELDISDGQVSGLVADQTASVSLGSTRTVHQTELEVVSRTVQDDGTYVYEFRVVDEGGDPVDGGHVVVDGTEYDITGGTATASFEPSGFAVTVVYEPPESPPGTDRYTDSQLYIPLNSNVPSPQQIFQFGAMVFVWLIPFALLGVAMDFFLGTTFFRDSIPGIMDTFRAIRDAIVGGDKQ